MKHKVFVYLVSGMVEVEVDAETPLMAQEAANQIVQEQPQQFNINPPNTQFIAMTFDEDDIDGDYQYEKSTRNKNTAGHYYSYSHRNILAIIEP